jgi:general secretion pathway protein G
MKKAFTLIELVFVIVIIGILVTIALPKFGAVSEQSQIAKGRSDVMALRTAISSERQKRFMLGDSSYINQLDGNASAAPGEDAIIFDNNGTSTNVLLTYGVVTKNSDGGWMKTGVNEYTYTISGAANVFNYDSTTGQFNCSSGTYCTQLTQ